MTPRRYRNRATGIDLLPDVPTESPGLWQDPALRGFLGATGIMAILLVTGWAALVAL